VAPAPPAAPRALTRAESLAIAAAVRDRLEAAQPTPSADANTRLLDSMTRVIQRIVQDSVQRALREAAQSARRGDFDARRWTLSAEELAKMRELGQLRVHQVRPESVERALRQAREAGGATGVGGAAVAGGAATGASGGARTEVRVDTRIAGAAARAPTARRGRRVVVADVRNATGRRDLSGVAAAIGRALREHLEAGQLYDVGRQPPQRDPSGSAAMHHALATQAGALLVPTLLVRGDSLVVQVAVLDVRRGFPVATVETATPAETPLVNVQRLAETLRSALATLSWPPPSPAAPDVRTPAVPMPPAPPAPIAPPPPA
jgi:hypothetical protein